MNQRYQEIMTHLAGLYPGMRSVQLKRRAAKMLSEELGPWFTVDEDGVVLPNKNWKQSMRKIDREFYGRVWNWLGQNRPDLAASVRENLSIEAVKGVRRWVASKKQEGLVDDVGNPDDPGRRAYAEAEVFNLLVKTHTKPQSKAFDLFNEPYLDSPYTSQYVGKNPFYKASTQVEINVQSGPGLNEFMSRFSQDAKTKHQVGSTDPLNPTQRYFENVFDRMGDAFDYAIRVGSTVEVRVREKDVVSMWRVSPNGVASQLPSK